MPVLCCVLQGDTDCSLEHLGQVEFGMLSHRLQTDIRVSLSLSLSLSFSLSLSLSVCVCVSLSLQVLSYIIY